MQALSQLSYTPNKDCDYKHLSRSCKPPRHCTRDRVIPNLAMLFRAGANAAMMRET